MDFCIKCVMPHTRPDLRFNDDGVCDACKSAELKFSKIDWDERKKEFENLIEKYKNKSSDDYDCLIPVSGGKDSHYSVYIAKKIYNLNPLCLAFEPTLPTEIGIQNLDNIHNLGVDLIKFKQNPIIYNKLIMEGFKRVGDMEWANHMGIWSVPVHFAIKFQIPLIFWGESPQLEYGGAETISDINKRSFDEDWVNDYGCLNGLRPQDMINDANNISSNDLNMYTYPNKNKVKEWGGLGVFMGYYFKWNTNEMMDSIESIGFKRRVGRIGVSYTDHEKLDCLSMNLHDYLKYLKFGYGRATDSACLDVRNGKINREEACRLVERYDGEYPKEAIEKFCQKFKLSKKEFYHLCEPFINPEIFERNKSAMPNDSKFIIDLDGSLVMKEQIIKKRRSSN